MPESIDNVRKELILLAHYGDKYNLIFFSYLVRIVCG